MLHSGSRGIGNKIAGYHINEAKSLHELDKLPHADLAYLIKGTKEFQNYVTDLKWAQDYALMNREVMMSRILKRFNKMFNDGKAFRPEVRVNCHHNYAEEEVHFGEKIFVTRKGAINAARRKYGIIPGSMGAKSYIVKGLGEEDSFHSCSHGAGRRMSRNQAKKTFSIEDVERQTEGVECRKDKGIIDEIPSAYKDIDTVMANQKDLVEVVAEIKQVICVKG